MTVKVSSPFDAATAGFEIEIELKYTLLRGNLSWAQGVFILTIHWIHKR